MTTSQPTPSPTKRVPIKGRKLNAGQRSLAYLRKEGYRAEVCEQYRHRVEGKGQKAIFAGGYRKDLFGFMDILAYGHAEVLAVQTTSRKEIATHVRQYRGGKEEVRNAILAWLELPGARFVIHGWTCLELPTQKGGTKVRWHCTERQITADDLIEPEF